MGGLKNVGSGVWAAGKWAGTNLISAFLLIGKLLWDGVKKLPGFDFGKGGGGDHGHGGGHDDHGHGGGGHH